MDLLATIGVSAVTAGITGVITFFIQERQLRATLRTEFMAEQAVKRLLLAAKWRKRSFDEIKKRIGGFDDDDLRKILVRSGAVRFRGEEQTELWGLIERNEGDL